MTSNRAISLFPPPSLAPPLPNSRSTMPCYPQIKTALSKDFDDSVYEVSKMVGAIVVYLLKTVAR